MPSAAERNYAQIKLQGQLVYLFAKAGVEDVLMEDGTTTLSTYLSNLMTTINALPTGTNVDTKISTATTNLYNQIMGITEEDGASVTEAYDTLKEVAQYITEHGTAAAQLTNTVSGHTTAIGEINTALDTLESALDDKVDKVAGKGLSTEDYTTAEKQKLGGVATGATKVEASTTNGNIKVNGEEMTVFTPEGVNVFVGSTAPNNMSDGDIFIQTVPAGNGE